MGDLEWVKFFQQSHAEMGDHAAAGSVAVIMFNLGYLPGENHELTTEASETLAALVGQLDRRPAEQVGGE